MSFISRLKTALQDINHEECPQVPNPPGCKKRASVAVVLRVRPMFPQKPTYDQDTLSSSAHTFQESLDGFFSQEWVQQGDPEVLLIRRAARAGDRWTSHIALPGGKREKEDPHDRATGERETREETGLELDIDHCLYIGNLPERTLKTAWNNIPLMVLCPFVYLQMRHDLPPLALQPSEVHSAHWTSLKGILSPSLRRDVRCDISERFTQQRAPTMRILIRAVAGQVIYGAVKLKPTESLYNSFVSKSVFINQHSTLLGSFTTRLLDLKQADEDDQPLLLWGLTLGIMADLLEIVDTPATSKLWSWPTFSPWDIRFTIWLLNRRFQSRKIREHKKTAKMSHPPGSNGVRIGGLDKTTYSTSVMRRSKGSEAGVTGMMWLAEYTHRLRRAVLIALLLRLAFGTAFSMFLFRKCREYRL